MRRGLLQDYANTMPDILCGWRLFNVPSDLERLLEARRGLLSIDALTARCLLDGQEVAPFGIAKEIQAWLQDRLKDDAVPAGVVEEATLTLTFEASRTPHGRKPSVYDIRLTFDGSSEVVTDGAKLRAAIRYPR
jgi:hypothetical protein